MGKKFSEYVADRARDAAPEEAAAVEVFNVAAAAADDDDIAAVARDRLVNDSGARHSLDEVIEMFGFDSDDLRAENEADS